MKTEKTYHIPLSLRKLENLHIVFWLIKDLSWCMLWKPLGILMILPTLAISIYISWKNRKYISETCHNAAISFWILANSFWMFCEFIKYDEKLILGSYSYKHIALIPFMLGVLILAWYYGIGARKYKLGEEMDV